MTHLAHNSRCLRDTYAEIGHGILLHGRRVSPRGIPTVEASPASMTFTDPLDALPTNTGRGVVWALAAVEALQLVAGVGDARTLVAASPRYAEFVDPDTGELDVAYGPRVGSQMADAERRLREDPDSRQAHVDFWRPGRDAPGLRAYPCVVSCGFQVRGGRVECFVEMRSNDFWLGLPYDAFAFSQLQATLANVLGLEVGGYSHYARSLHVYEKDVPKVESLVAPPRQEAPPRLAGVSGGSMASAALRARGILNGQRPNDATESEMAYLEIMRETVLPKVGPA